MAAVTTVKSTKPQYKLHLCDVLVDVKNERGRWTHDWVPAFARYTNDGKLLEFQYAESDRLYRRTDLKQCTAGKSAGSRWTQWRFVHHIFLKFGATTMQEDWPQKRPLAPSDSTACFSDIDDVIRQGVDAQALVIQAAFAFNWRLVHYIVTQHGFVNLSTLLTMCQSGLFLDTRCNGL